MKKYLSFLGISLVSCAIPLIFMFDEQQAFQTEYEELQRKYGDLQTQYSLLQKSQQDTVKQVAVTAQTLVVVQGKLKEAQQQIAKEKASRSMDLMKFRASYYDLGVASTGKIPGSRGYGITRSGRPVKKGVTIAVDPKVIPLNSWVEITYPDGKVERRRADDTGSAIKGHKIDIYVPNAKGKGVHPVQVRVIKP